MDDLYIHTKCDYGQIMIHPLKCVIYNQFKQTQKNKNSNDRKSRPLSSRGKILNNYIKCLLLEQSITRSSSKKYDNNIITSRPSDQMTENVASRPSAQRTESDKTKIMDLGCGKGQDVHKWERYHGKVIFVDFVKERLEEAKRRWEANNNSYSAAFVCADFTEPSMTNTEPFVFHTNEKVTPPSNQKQKKNNTKVVVPKPFSFTDDIGYMDNFDVVSCQFAAHHACGSLEHTKTFLANVSKSLKSGGVFVGTIPDMKVVRMRMNGEKSRINECYYMIECDNDNDIGVHSTVYTFSVRDSKHDPWHRFVEYSIDWNLFKNLARDVGLEIELDENSLDFYHHQRNNLSRFGYGLAQRMNMTTKNAPREQDLDFVSLYQVFRFRKQ